MSPNKLCESDIEEAAIDWLEQLGYEYAHGSELERPKKEVVLKDDLNDFLKRTYPSLPDIALADAMIQFSQPQGAELDQRNRDFHLKMTKGVDLTWEEPNGNEGQAHVYPIDYENIENNRFLVVNQFSIKGKNDRRPDMILFINGLPVIVFEFKDMFNPNATVEHAFNQIQHYVLDIPRLFEFNAITILSDGDKALHGMYPSNMEWYAPWKSIDGVEIEAGDLQLHTMLQGLFPKERLLSYLKNFIFHEDDNGKLTKKGAKYHQFFGVSEAVERTKTAIKPKGDGRIGVIWHTQGSGKSISMAIYTGLLKSLKELNSPTILIQVDRNDLDQQLFDNFELAGDLVGKIERADSTDDLRKLLDRQSGGVIFSTIEKFRLKGNGDNKELVHPILTERENIIVIADEAHRTQYGLLDGYAHHLRKAIPNASFIGFTGTPVDSKDSDTQAVFGPNIHVYDMKQSEEDGATVGIVYEPRFAKLHLANHNIDEEAEEIAGHLSEDEGNQLKWAALADAAGNPDRVAKIAKDLLAHYTNRTGMLPGKAMVVCMSRANCVKMYDALTALEGAPEVAVIMTGDISKDPKEWNEHIRTKEQREALKTRFKKPDDPLKIVMVRDMWLTGFDAPCIHSMYVDKIMQGHNLMQAITRVNRVFKDKPKGLIVDYIGIGNKLKEATKKYTGGGGTGRPTIDYEEVIQLCLEQVESVRELVDKEVEYSNWSNLSSGDRLLLIKRACNQAVKTDESAKAFMTEEKKMSGLVSIVKHRPELDLVKIDIIFFQHVAQYVRKIKSIGSPVRKVKKEIKELIHRSIESDEIVDVYAMAGLEKPDISILDDKFLFDAKEQKDSTELKVEMIRQIMDNEIKINLTKNVKRYTSLKAELERVIKDYHTNAEDAFSTIANLIKTAKEMQDEAKRHEELGLSADEVAFYDILHSHEDALKEEGLVKDIVSAVVKAIKDNAEIDWYRKPDATSRVRLAVKRELRGKVNPGEIEKLLAEILEQAEESLSA